MRKPYLLFILILPLIFSGCVGKKVAFDQNEARENNVRSDMAAIGNQAWHQQLNVPLSLEQMMGLAKKHNLEYLIKELEAEQADHELAAVKLASLPKAKVDVNTNYDTTDGFAFNKNQATGTKSATAATSSQKFGGTANISLQWSVLDYGISYYRAKQKVYARAIVDERQRRALHKLAMNLVQDYMRVSVADAGLKLAKIALDDLKDASRRMEKLSKINEIDEYNALQYKSKQIALENAKEALREEKDASMLRLAQTIGVTPGTSFRVQMPDFSDSMMPSVFDVDTLVEEALRRRPELFEADLQERITLEEVKAIGLQRWPNFAGILGLNFNSNKFLYANSWANIGSALSWDLLSIPRLNQEKSAKEVRAKVQVRERQLLALGVMAEVHLANADYQLKGERYRRMKDELKLHRALLSLARTRARAGKLSNVDLIAHEASAIEKSIQLARSYADWVEALQKIYYATQKETPSMDNLTAMPVLASIGYRNQPVSLQKVSTTKDAKVAVAAPKEEVAVVKAITPPVVKAKPVAVAAWKEVKPVAVQPRLRASKPKGAKMLYHVYLPKPRDMSNEFVKGQLSWLRKNGFPDAYLKRRGNGSRIMIGVFSQKHRADEIVYLLQRENLHARIDPVRI
ncbi:MAG: TolC family protein [Mariprofundaceae bacterium]|nr:TolC family protein [Mariprofundaceae bacterium]